MHLPVGTTLLNKKYTIISTIAQGGFGITYKAEDSALGRIVAIKEFFCGSLCTRQPNQRKIQVTPSMSELVNKLKGRFMEEARRIAKLKHDNIISIYDVFEENATAYYVMEYVENGSLEEYIKTNGSLTELQSISYIHQLCNALEYLHAKKICHLDIKPANVLLDDNDRVKLVDFGLSKQYDENEYHTTTFMAVSNGYAPLEQYSKKGVSEFQPATDIYALGATMYFLLTGQRPPEATTLVTKPFPHIPAASQRMNAAIAKAMSTDKKNRHQNISEFKREIDNSQGLLYRWYFRLTQMPFTHPATHDLVDEDNDDVTEITNKRTSIEAPNVRKISTLKRMAKGILFFAAFTLFIHFIYYQWSMVFTANHFHKSLKALKISYELGLAFKFGLTVFTLFYCIGYEWISHTNKSRNIFSLLSFILFFAALVAYWSILSQEKPLPKLWFIVASSVIPFFVYFVRFLLFSKLHSLLFQSKK